jgi:hypothetical protein
VTKIVIAADWGELARLGLRELKKKQSIVADTAEGSTAK